MTRYVLASILMLLICAPAKADTILMGIVCNNTCFGFQEGDNTPDYLGLFGPLLGELIGPFTLDIGTTTYSLTVNEHTLTFAKSDPTKSISFTDPLLVSFAPGSFKFTAIGNNIFGFGAAEIEFFCPEFPPGVPEPSTWVMFLVGFALIAFMYGRRSRGRFNARVL